MKARATHFGMPNRRIQRSAGVATMAINTARSSGATMEAVSSRKMTMMATAAATIRARAMGEEPARAFISQSPLSLSRVSPVAHEPAVVEATGKAGRGFG